MKYMTMVHETVRPSAQPPAELFAALGAAQAADTADGTFVEAGGLMPIELDGAIVTIAGGSSTVTDGPFVEAKELVGGWAVYDVPDVDTLMAKVQQFVDIHLRTWPGWEGWVEVRRMFGPED